MSTYPNTLEAILGPNLDQLIQELDEYFPPVNPTPETELNQIMYRAGQRSIVEWLKQRTEKTNVPRTTA